MSRLLVVTADDLGASPGVNEGVRRAHLGGVVTSASLMVRRPAAEQAVVVAAELRGLSVGLHLELGEWAYLDGGWVEVRRLADAGDRADVEREVAAQVAAFCELVGRPPTHLDSHQHVHRAGVAAEVVGAVADELGVPLRARAPLRYCGEFHGQSGRGEPYPEGITVEALVDVVRRLPEGTTELACHPSAADDLDSPYSAERLVELAALCDPRVRRAIEHAGVRLVGFAELGPDGQPKRPDT